MQSRKTFGRKRMKKFRYKRAAALLAGLLMALQPSVGAVAPVMKSYAYTEKTGKVTATTLNVRSAPGSQNSLVGKLSYGTSVTVIGEQKASDGTLWYQIRFSGSGGSTLTGYVLHTYIKLPTTYSSDSDFEAYLTSQGFPESYKSALRELHAKYPNWIFTAQKTGLDWNDVIENESVVTRNLVYGTSISSWKSTADGAYNWETSTWPGFDGATWVAASSDIIRYYMDPRNFLDETYIFQFLLQSYDSSAQNAEGLQSLVSGTFLAGNASDGSGGSGSGSGGPGVVDSGSGTLVSPGGSTGTTGSDENSGPGVVTGVQPGSSAGTDSSSPGGSSGTTSSSPGSSAPTSGDSEVRFEAPQASVTVNKPTQVATAVISAGPGSTDGPGGSTSGTVSSSGSSSYVDILMNAGAQSGVNPYVLAAMILQEQGTQGTGGSISGTESGYEGYYNFFNIEAYQSGNLSAVQRGLWYASQSGSYSRPWNSVEKSIIGGAQYYGTNYVKVGQDTFYLKKFNVQGSNLYKHQYMTNVQAAASEGAKLAKAYATVKQAALEFKIPIYNNMPEVASAKPTLDGSPNNKLSGLGVDGFVITPTFNRDTTSYDLIVDHSVSSVTVSASVYDSTASVSGTGTIQLQSGNNDITISVKAQNGDVRQYVLHVVRQDNGPTYTAGVGGSTGGSSVQTGSSGGPGVTINPDGSSTSGTLSPGSTGGPGSGSSQTESSGENSGPGASSQGPVSGNSGQSSSPGGDQVLIISPDGSAQSSGTSSPGGSSQTTGTSQEPGTAETTQASTTSPGQSSGGTKGDINGDGKVSVADVTRLQRHILGLETLSGSEAAAADMNGDGTLDVRDVMLMQKEILGS